MSALAITITNAGRAALVNAQNTGTTPLVISQIALGSGTYTPVVTQTALTAEIKRLSTFGADVVADDTIHITVTDETTATYNLGEFGLYTDTGVLFAVYSQPTWILQKTADQMVLLAADILFTSVPAGSVTIGSTQFSYPPASTIKQGIVELATDAETIAGTDTTRAVTPASLSARTATDTRTGLVELATDAEAITGTDTTRAVTPANLSARTATATRTGLVELATDAEAIAGTDTTRAVTPANLSARTATDTRTGLVELATDAEAIAGTDTTRAVTPANLSARTASDTRTGLVELATPAESATGTDSTRAVTPAGLTAFATGKRANKYFFAQI